jgi:hypothetical protein
MPKPLAALVALVAAVTITAATAAPAGAATPCWKRVIKDWSDHGGLTGHYSARCLNKALKNAPPDLASYTSILDDISALLSGSGNGSGKPPATSSEMRGQNQGPGQLNPQQREAIARQKNANDAVSGAGTAGSIPDSSRSVPLPLILLGALALAAALAAASPPLFRRFGGRFPRFRPGPESVRRPS